MEISINYLAVLVAAVVSFAVGAWWHSPWGFGAQWMRMMNLKPEDMGKMPLTATQAMLIGFIVTVVVCFVTAHFVALLVPLEAAAWMSLSLQLGFWVWLGFMAPTLANGWLWEGKSLKLFLFNAAYALVNIEVISLVLAAWR